MLYTLIVHDFYPIYFIIENVFFSHKIKHSIMIKMGVEHQLTHIVTYYFTTGPHLLLSQ